MRDRREERRKTEKKEGIQYCLFNVLMFNVLMFKKKLSFMGRNAELTLPEPS